MKATGWRGVRERMSKGEVVDEGGINDLDWFYRIHPDRAWLRLIALWFYNTKQIYHQLRWLVSVRPDDL